MDGAGRRVGVGAARTGLRASVGWKAGRRGALPVPAV